MSLPNFKTQIQNIRKEAIEMGFSIKTMDGYLTIWNKFINWKKQENFIYNEEDYKKFLLEHYNFDVDTYTRNSKSRHQQYIRSKRMLDDFDKYKEKISKTMLPHALYCDYPIKWNPIVENYLNYCKSVKQNSESSIKLKRIYLGHILAYFNKNGINNLGDFNKKNIVEFINQMVHKGDVSKRRNFSVLRDFLQYLFIESILNEDLSIYIPKSKQVKRKKIPTYLKQEKIEELLNNISKETKVEIRDYAIILLAARLGLRVSDILNIKLKDIDWINHKLNITQPKTANLNTLPLSKEVGWAIINYIKKSRPIANNEYLFIKFKYPFEKMDRFANFDKYFDRIDIDISTENKKGIHNLRHSLATNMLENEIPIDIIASTLGHSNKNTTNTYLKVDIKNLKRCALEVDE